MEARVWSCLLFISFAVFLYVSPAVAAEDVAEAEVEKVLTLDHSNFSEVVSKHEFIVVEFYAPWCGHCKALAPEYEKAASVLSSHEPPIVLAKVDASDEANRDLASEYNIQGIPALRILRNGGKSIQEYKGPREADGIVSYLKKQVGPASAEINSVEDAESFIDDKSVFIVGVFPKFSGEEFENFSALAEKLRSDYGFGHTLSSKFIPRGESVSKPTLRLLKPFDELVVDFHDFQVDAMEKFIEESSVPILTVWSSDPSSNDYLKKFFSGDTDKAMLFVNFSTDHDAFQSIYKDVAASYKGKGVSFLLGDIDAAQGAFQYFGLQVEQAPVLVIQKPNGQKYLNANVKPDQIGSWVKDFANGLLKPFIKSEPIPEVNDEPVKVVVTASLEDMVFNSGKNVLLEFYAPWCGHCQKLAPILEEVAASFAEDSDVLIAKLDATANDVPSESFDVKGFPTVYFRSASGTLSQYGGDRTKEAIIQFIQENRDKPAESTTSTESQTTKSESVKEDSVKDEL